MDVLDVVGADRRGIEVRDGEASPGEPPGEPRVRSDEDAEAASGLVGVTLYILRLQVGFRTWLAGCIGLIVSWLRIPPT